MDRDQALELARRSSATRGAGRARGRGPSRRLAGRVRVASPRGPRGGRAPQAPPRRAQLRRPAQPARRRPRRARAPAARADAAAVEVRADRRVPGHRPGAVAGVPAGLRRARHDGADRRPQAGDLRLPRRRHRDLPHRGRPRRPRRRWGSTGAATAAARALQRCSRAPRSATSASSCTPSRRTTESPTGGRRAPFRLRVVRRAGARQAARVQPRSAWCAPRITDAAHDIKRLLERGATFDGRPAAAGRHRGAGGPPRELEATQEALPRSACLASSTAAAASSTRRRPTSGWRCSRRWSSRTAPTGCAPRR